MGLVRCRHTCGVGHRGLGVDVWPQITGTITMNNPDTIDLQPIAVENMQFSYQNSQSNNEFWTINTSRLIAKCLAKRPSAANHDKHVVNVAGVVVYINIEDNSSRLRIGVNETYRINISGPSSVSNNTIRVVIDAFNIFGARHGIETLSQLIIYDDIRNVFLLRSNVRLEDGPVYSHRGISLDTARNYYPVDDIKRTIGK